MGQKASITIEQKPNGMQRPPITSMRRGDDGRCNAFSVVPIRVSGAQYSAFIKRRRVAVFQAITSFIPHQHSKVVMPSKFVPQLFRKYRLATNLNGHKDAVFSLAIAGSGRYLASGGMLFVFETTIAGEFY